MRQLEFAPNAHEILTKCSRPPPIRAYMDRCHIARLGRLGLCAAGLALCAMLGASLGATTVMAQPGPHPRGAGAPPPPRPHVNRPPPTERHMERQAERQAERQMIMRERVREQRAANGGRPLSQDERRQLRDDIRRGGRDVYGPGPGAVPVPPPAPQPPNLPPAQ